MNGLRRARAVPCSARATSSLPVPDSPVISTVMLERDSRPIARNTSCIAGAWPSISGMRRDSAGRRRASVRSALRGARARARRPGRCRTASAGTRTHRPGTRRPRCRDPSAPSSRSPAVAAAGCGSRSSRSRPLRPGMRMSVTSTSGSSRASAASTASASSNAVGLHAALLERPLEHPADRRVVVDDPDVKRFR